MSILKKTSLVILLTVAAACTVQETPAPPLTGPSELGLRLNLQFVPDSILQDGASQAVLQIDASGPDGRPVRGLPLRLEIVVGGILADFGTLSAKTVITGDDGRARVTYTSPPRPPQPVDEFVVISIMVTPIGNDFRGEFRRVVDLRLVPPGMILPPNDPPVPSFTFTPSAPQVRTPVAFDASATTDEGVACPSCTFRWDFGDSTTGTGIFATHEFQTAGNFQVRLTVTDIRGASAQTARPVPVAFGQAPTAAFTFSPSSPAIGQLINFTAEASRAAPGRRIVSYDWNFGTGRTATGVTTSKAYDAAGMYTVTLTVTDDTGQQGTVSQQVTVGAAGTGPTAALIVSPGQGSTSTNFFFDASGSRPGPSPIVEYRFTFGDATPDVVGQSPTTTHRYTTPGSYIARVTVRDSANRTSQAQVTISIQ